MKLKNKLIPDAIPDSNLLSKSYLPTPSFKYDIASPKSIIELGTDDFLPQSLEDRMDSCGESNNLFLLASVAEEAQGEIRDFSRKNLGENFCERGNQTNLCLTSVVDSEQKLKRENSKLKTILEEKGRYISYLKNQLAEVSKKLKKLEKEMSDKEKSFQQSQSLRRNLPPQVSRIVENSLKNCNRQPNGRRYDNYFKTLALGVYFLSPVADRHLKSLLRVFPEEKTLYEFVSEWPHDPGSSSSSLKCLELRSRGFTQDQKFVSVLCDEMALKSHMQYVAKYDKIIGVEDYGDENRTCRIGNSDMTLMVQGIGGVPWTHPLSYFIVHGSCKRDVAKKYIFEAITQLQNISLTPCHFVCDQGSNFIYLARILGVSEERPYFQVNGKDVFFFSILHIY
ncbi:uncharacterized protein LOC129250729 [Anastrepha obliqua]|uniref:uncharacterized protein LOC129250729 n=1 Tax=Anastrepha obliqua TaxID=95512 RepID=UPI0024093671|nr:uncharacterized protein LOC129250729 [Anastrepha obliqua]